MAQSPDSLTPEMRPLPKLIFMSRWLQLPLYLGLIAAQGVYVWHFLLELWHLIDAAFGNATGARLSSDKSLYIGARPNGAFNTFNFSHPLIFWRGAVDEVRISRTARYIRNFIPAAKLSQDDATLLLLTLDQQFGPFIPSDAGSQVQARILGNAAFAPAER